MKTNWPIVYRVAPVAQGRWLLIVAAGVICYTLVKRKAERHVTGPFRHGWGFEVHGH